MKTLAKSSRRVLAARAVGAGALVAGALLIDATLLPVLYADPGSETGGGDCAEPAGAIPERTG